MSEAAKERREWWLLAGQLVLHGFYLGCALSVYSLLYMSQSNATTLLGSLLIACAMLIVGFLSRSLAVAVLVIVAFPSILLAGEIAVRWSFLGWEAVASPYKGHSIPTLNSGIARAVDDPVLAYDLIPGWQGYIKGREISINSHGYRDADYAVGPKAANEFRIIGLGHSFAYASGVEAENGFFERLADILNERLSPTHFRVNNLAVPAESIPHWNRRLVRDGLAADPDLVLLSLTLDSSSVYPTENQVEKLKNSASKNLALSGDSLYAFRKLLIARNNLAGKITSRLGRLQQMLLQPKASSRPPADPGPTLRDSLAEAAAIAAEAEVSFAVVSLRPMAFGSDSARYEPRNDMLRELCEEIGIRFIDTWDALPESGDLARFTVFPGDNHPNATGHAAYARIIADQLVPWVRELRASGMEPR